MIFASVSPTDATFQIRFSVPGQPGTPAYTNGFGIVFLDVQLANTTVLRFYDVNGVLIHTQFAQSNAANGAFSFVGVSFTNEQIARVDVTPGQNGFCSSGLGDCVAMDDFIYGEPQAIASGVPEPSSVTMACVGLGAIFLAARRRRS